MNILDVVIDANASVGKNLLLTDVRPYYAYAGNQKLDKVVGYRYDVVLTEKKFEKLSVKVEGKQKVELSDSVDYLPVVFDDLKLRLYTMSVITSLLQRIMSGGYNIAATANNVRVIKRE